MKKYALFLVLFFSFSLFTGMITGCDKKEVASTALSEEEQARLRAEQERLRRQMEEGNLRESGLEGTLEQQRDVFINQDIHFDYDRYDLRDDAKQILNQKAAYMQVNSTISVVVEGHCDARGSYAYNMALGEKRARSAAAYLVALGVSASRIEIVSYGSERPLIQGYTEEAFFANRRGHFVIK